MRIKIQFILYLSILSGLISCSNEKQLIQSAKHYDDIRFCEDLEIINKWANREISTFSILCQSSIHPSPMYFGIKTPDTCFVLGKIDSTFKDNIYLTQIINKSSDSTEIKKEIYEVIKEIQTYNNFYTKLKL